MALVCALQEGAAGSKELPECVLEVPSLHEVELNHGKQDLPDFSRPGSAAGEPIMKERALLQVFSSPASTSHQLKADDSASFGWCFSPWVTRRKGLCWGADAEAIVAGARACLQLCKALACSLC